jgi:hypothetical protein
MALLSPTIPSSLFYRSSGYSVGEIRLHLILDEEHMLDAKVTTHSVEDGSEISDHIYNELERGSLRGMVSNYGLQTDPALFFPENIALQAFEDLKRLRDKREPVTIVTVLKVYEEVLITNIKAKRDGETGEQQIFEIKFQEIKKSTLKSVTINFGVNPPDMNSPLNRQAAPKSFAGKTL